MSLARLFALALPAYHHVNYRGVPIFRAHAWALEDARLHGQDFTVLSGDRRTSIIHAFNRKYGTHLHDQQYLWNGWFRRLPGFLPANPPDRGTHLLLGDGTVGRLHEKLKPYQLGIDVVSAGHVNDAGPLVVWLNAHGYHVTRPYHTGAEAHHILFTQSPATNARKRLAAHHAKPKPKRRRVTKVSGAGVDLIARFEGGQSRDGLFHPYQDPVGVWTIGYGHTAGVTRNSKPLTGKQALALLKRDLDRTYAPHVAALKLPLNQHQFDALVSFVFNLGPGAISASTGIGKALRAHHWRQAGDEMLEWDHAGGKVLPGLKRRREAERTLFLKGAR